MLADDHTLVCKGIIMLLDKIPNISVKTVESHRRNIMEKLGLKGQVELIKYALREGVVPLDTWLSSNKRHLLETINLAHMQSD